MTPEDQKQPPVWHRALSGGVLLLIGLGMLAIGWDYPVGQLTQMGPGFVPRAIALMICAIAAAIITIDVQNPRLGRGDDIHWRGLIFVAAAILIFAGLVDVAGLVPSMFLAVAVSMFADKQVKPLTVLIYSVVATLIGWLLFLVILELPIPAFWRWS
ncbi:tripartite tricarboxylate transporter TctB family protein [Rhodobacteraceae bacterium M385]|nr:tripartite tricarboxylate transporter TctB family protein [Rhodobacteraceae bacterium M385]